MPYIVKSKIHSFTLLFSADLPAGVVTRFCKILFSPNGTSTYLLTTISVALFVYSDFYLLSFFVLTLPHVSFIIFSVDHVIEITIESSSNVFDCEENEKQEEVWGESDCYVQYHFPNQQQQQQQQQQQNGMCLLTLFNCQMTRYLDNHIKTTCVHFGTNFWQLKGQEEIRFWKVIIFTSPDKITEKIVSITIQNCILNSDSTKTHPRLLFSVFADWVIYNSFCHYGTPETRGLVTSLSVLNLFGNKESGR